jgi:hybrid cluster-associated redox disulfide protein
MNADRHIDPDLPLDQLMRQWPSAVRVFIRHEIHCVGCTLAPFHCLRDASILHDVDEDMLVREILEASRSG